MTDKFQQWAIVEMFGHQRIAGLVTEQQVGGCSFVRVDVPEASGRPAFTKLLGNGAIYAINFVSEDVARQAAQSFRAEPVSVYDLPALRQAQIGAPAETAQEVADRLAADCDDDDDDDDDEHF